MIRKLNTIPEIVKELPFNEKACTEVMELILRNGFEEENSIIVWKGKDLIVDGAHRYEACKRLNIEPLIFERKFESLKHAIIYAFRHQTKRRNVTPSIIVALNLKANDIEDSLKINEVKEDAHDRMLSGKSNPSPPAAQGVKANDTNFQKGRTDEIIAKKMGVGKTTYQLGKNVHENGIPELTDMMVHNELSAKSGNLFVKNVPKKEDQKIIFEKGGVEAVKEKIKEIKEEKKEEKEIEKVQTEQEKFLKLTQNVDSANKEILEKVHRNTNNGSCGCSMPDFAEIWCNDCQWGFDIYIPTPSTYKCPYCSGSNLKTREKNWYPNKEMI